MYGSYISFQWMGWTTLCVAHNPTASAEEFVQLIELKDREERRRLSWIVAYRERPDAGAVCRRFGISRPTLRKWLRRYEAEGEVGLRALSRRAVRQIESQLVHMFFR